MDHAEAHERIADLALEPQRLVDLDGSDATDDAALRAHVNTCPRCQAELSEWRDFQAAVGATLASDRREQLEPIAPPADLRRRVLAAARSQAHSRPADVTVVAMPPSRPALARSGLLALAAVFALVATGLGVLFVRDQSAQLDRTTIVAAWMSQTVGAVSRVLAEPDHHVITLRTGDGGGGGAIAWSRHDLVVLAGALPAPAAGQVYRCWIDYENAETPVGSMWFVDGTAFWVGSTEDWASIDLNPDKQFLVTLESTTNLTNRHIGAVVLQASLGG